MIEEKNAKARLATATHLIISDQRVGEMAAERHEHHWRRRIDRKIQRFLEAGRAMLFSEMIVSLYRLIQLTQGIHPS